MLWVFHRWGPGGRLSTAAGLALTSGLCLPNLLSMTNSIWAPDELLKFLDERAAHLAPGGVFRALSLRRIADPRPALDILLRRGQVIRIRRGWYSSPSADHSVVRAVGSGGVLSCLSALQFAGIWVPAASGLHVRVDRSAIVAAHEIHVCGAFGRLPTPLAAVDPVQVALRAATGCTRADEMLAVLDSAVLRGHIRKSDLAAHLAGTTGKAIRLSGQVMWADSGTESLARYRLRRLGLRVQTQVTIPGVGRVDLLIGDRLVLEIDSVSFHDGEDWYHRDRRRDLLLTELGYRTLRVSWEQVTYGWPEVEAAILSIVAAGEHLWPKGIGNRATK